MKSQPEIEKELDQIAKLIELRLCLPVLLGTRVVEYLGEYVHRHNEETPNETDAYNRGLVDGKYQALLWVVERSREI